jgi:Zn finger protein HypA/HybF involved in hydrogenase expression
MAVVTECRYCGYDLMPHETGALCGVCQGRAWDVYAADGTVVQCEGW